MYGTILRGRQGDETGWIQPDRFAITCIHIPTRWNVDTHDWTSWLDRDELLDKRRATTKTHTCQHAHLCCDSIVLPNRIELCSPVWYSYTALWFHPSDRTKNQRLNQWICHTNLLSNSQSINESSHRMWNCERYYQCRHLCSSMIARCSHCRLT